MISLNLAHGAVCTNCTRSIFFDFSILTRTALKELNLIVIRSAIPLNNINMICLLTWCNLTAANVSICTNAAGAAVPWFHRQPFPCVKKFQNMKLPKSGMSLSAPFQLMANILNYKTQGEWWCELYIQSFLSPQFAQLRYLFFCDLMYVCFPDLLDWPYHSFARSLL